MAPKSILYRGVKYVLAASQPTKPKDVVRLEKALIANGKEAGVPKNLAAYVHYDGMKREWIVGPNAEGFGGSFVLKSFDGRWYHRDPHEGTDTLAKHGIEECLSDASIYYTG